jgi:hypothetical protein
MVDGKPRRYAQIADASGFQVNTVERYCHEINTGKHGPYRIETQQEPDRSTVLAWLVNTTATYRNATPDSFVEECRERLAGYPDNHPERAKVAEQIARHQSKARAA